MDGSVVTCKQDLILATNGSDDSNVLVTLQPPDDPQEAGVNFTDLILAIGSDVNFEVNCRALEDARPRGSKGQKIKREEPLTKKVLREQANLHLGKADWPEMEKARIGAALAKIMVGEKLRFWMIFGTILCFEM